MLNLKIHELNTMHYESWLELYLQYAKYYKVEIPSDKFKLTWRWLNNKDHPLQGIIAEFNDKYVGFAHFRSMPSPLESCEIGFLDDLFVAPKFRGRKIGFKLIQRVKKNAEDKGWPYINWITKDDNYSARSLYDKIAKKTDWNFYELVVTE